MAYRPAGTTSASVIVVVLVGLFVGALAGAVLDGLVANKVVLAVIAGLVATLVATVVRYKLVYRLSGAGADDTRIPGLLLVNAVIASIAGSLAGYYLAGQIDPTGFDSLARAGIVGGLAGLLSGVLMAILMITYHTIPNQSSA